MASRFCSLTSSVFVVPAKCADSVMLVLKSWLLCHSAIDLTKLPIALFPVVDKMNPQPVFFSEDSCLVLVYSSVQLSSSNRVEDNKYVGVLSGLGPVPGAVHSFYPDCEVELVFDGVITEEDVAKVCASSCFLCISMRLDRTRKYVSRLFLLQSSRVRSALPFRIV